MRNRFQAKDPKSWALKFHAQTAGSTLTAQQPENNVVRVTLQALAAVLGGTQSLHTNGSDEALGLSTDDTARVALRTQQIIGFESGVTNTVDPLAGSYVIEALTLELEKLCLKYLTEIEARGGTVKCIENGYIQNEILNSAYRDQRAVEKGEMKVIGVNCFKDESSKKTQVLKIDPALELDAVKKLRAFKNKRNNSNVEASLKSLKIGAASNGNLQSLILESARMGATLGEISTTLREVFGEYREYSKF